MEETLIHLDTIEPVVHMYSWTSYLSQFHHAD